MGNNGKFMRCERCGARVPVLRTGVRRMRRALCDLCTYRAVRDALRAWRITWPAPRHGAGGKKFHGGRK